MKTVRFDNPCDECTLNCNQLQTKGSKDAIFMVVTKAPNRKQIHGGRHLSPAAMKVFAKEMTALGFDKDDFIFHSAVMCEFDKTIKETMTAKERHVIEKACREHLLRAIEEIKPTVIIPLGVEAASAVMGRKIKITKVRGVPEYHREHDCIILPMLDPDQVVMYPQNAGLFKSDAAVLAKMDDHEYDLESVEEDSVGDYRLVDDLQFIVDAAPEVIAFDTETLGTRWQEQDKKLLTLQFTYEEGKAYILSWDHPDRPMPLRKRAKIREQLKQILCRPEVRIVGHNLKYDAMWAWAKLGIRFRIAEDTLMMIATLDENLMSKDLNTLTKMYIPEMGGYDDTFNAKYDKSRMDLVPLMEIVNYGGGDTDAAFRLFHVLEKELMKDKKLYNNYRTVSMPGVNAFATVEKDGMIIDEEALDNLEEVVAAGQAELFRSLIGRVPRSIKRKHAEKGCVFSRQEFTRDVLFDHPDGFTFKPVVYTKSTAKLPDESMRKASVSTKDHLPYFFDKDPFVMELADYIKNERMLGTNIRKFRENYMHNGKVYPIYSLWTAVTGRSASRDPNGQNFPKRGEYAKAYRSIFTPPPGYVLLEADLSQAELRISGDMANDPVIIDIYNNDGDIHTSTAAMVMGVSLQKFMEQDPDERKLARFKAKAVNFGFIYGMGWRKFVGYAKTQYGVEFTDREAEAIREGYFRLYPALEPWHGKMRAFARKHGFVRSYSGRVRHLPMIASPDDYIRSEAERQAINSPVQEFGSTLGVMAMSRIEQEVDQDYLKLMGFVHDALYAYVRLEHLEWGAKTLKHYMETNPLEEWFDRRMKVPIKSDVGFGPHGGKTYEMETLKLDRPYDFGDIEDLSMDIPEQVVPPNNGRKDVDPYLSMYSLADRLRLV